jgi:hypothetical protein
MTVRHELGTPPDAAAARSSIASGAGPDRRAGSAHVQVSCAALALGTAESPPTRLASITPLRRIFHRWPARSPPVGATRSARLSSAMADRLTPRTRHDDDRPISRAAAVRERDEQLRRALNLAATLPASDVVVIEPTDGEKLGTIRAALARLLEDEPRELNWGVRDGRIIISKGTLPPRALRRER